MKTILNLMFLGTLLAGQLVNNAHAAPPVVNWLLPTNGASFGNGTPILLRASASDADGTLSSIDFVVAGSTLLRRFSGTLTNGVYSFMWSNAPVGINQLHAEAADNAGDRGVSAPVQIVVTNTPPPDNVPVVNLTTPTNGAVFPVGAPIRLSATASDSDGTLSSLQFLAGATLLRTISGPLTNGTYSFLWTNAPAGMFLVRAEAVDNAGGRGVSALVQISVSAVTNDPPTNPLPVVNWIQPTNGSVFSVGTPILLRASASDADGTLSSIDFLAGATLLRRISGALTNGVYSFWWTNAPAGMLQLRALAEDNAGARGTSAPVQISVTATNSPATNNVLPVVNWLRPIDGDVLVPGTPTLLTVSASDPDGTVNYVEFYAASIYLGRGIKVPTNSNYNLTWTNPPAGIFQLRAEAVDNAGGRGLSASVHVRVGSGAAIDLGIVEVPNIGHEYFTSNSIPPSPLAAAVDFLIDQDRSSDGGGVLRDVSVNWDTNLQFKLTVAAPPQMKFLVTVPPGRSVKFGGYLWWESTRGGLSGSGPVTASFADLEGTAPQFNPSDAVLSDSHGFFGFVDLESTRVTNNFAFTAITLTGTVAPQYTGNGTQHYLPHLASSMYLTSSTTGANDQGNVVAIVPTGPLPVARMSGRPDGAGLNFTIYGRPGRTHIVECSVDTVAWTAISTHVMPAQGSMPVRDATANTLDSRFYRVVELP